MMGRKVKMWIFVWVGLFFFFLTKERELKMPQRSCFALKGHRITAKLPGVF